MSEGETPSAQSARSPERLSRDEPDGVARSPIPPCFYSRKSGGFYSRKSGGFYSRKSGGFYPRSGVSSRALASSMVAGGLALDVAGLMLAPRLVPIELPFLLILLGTSIAFLGVRLLRQPAGTNGRTWEEIEALTSSLPARLSDFVRKRSSREEPRVLSALKESLDHDECREEWRLFLARSEGTEWSKSLARKLGELSRQPSEFWDGLPYSDSDLKPWMLMVFDDRRDILSVAAQNGGDPLPVPILQSMSTHEAARLRSMAIEDLARHASPDSLDLILALLVESRDVHVRRAAASMLAARNDGNVEEVIAIALVDEDRAVRTQAARALRGRRESAKLVFLIEGALLDSESVRRQAIEALASCSSDRAMTLLASALEDSASSVRESAMRGLVRQEQLGSSGKLMRYLNEGQLTIYRAMKEDLSRRTADDWMAQTRSSGSDPSSRRA